MKRIMLFLIVVVVLGMSQTSCYDATPDARTVAVQAQEQSAQKAVQAVSIPSVSYFQEKRTIAKWAERWDKPAITTYVYLFSFGNCIGYYVSNGKPASTRSYLMPEESVLNDPHGSSDAGSLIISAPDIDGTYGENNPGIRFFTAEGTAVEWAGSGASYLYSDAPLPLNVPKLNTK